MGPISESDMTYSMDTYFRQTWRDDRLKFSGPYDQLAVSTMILNEIWKPDTYFHNGQGAYLHTTTTPNKLLRIRNNGVVLYSMRLTIKASCPMYLQRFPVDMQSCPLQFGSYAYTSKHVVYEWKNGQHNSIETAGDMRLSQFDLVSTPAETVVVSNNSGEFSTLKVHFVLQRHMGYFLIQVYVPCTLIVILSWVSFWINREATSDRVSLGILTELTLTTISMDTRNDVPRVAYATALDHFFIMCYVFVTATLLEFAGVHYFTKIGSGEATFDADYCPPSEDSADDEGEDIPNNTNSMHYHSNSVYYRSHDNQCSLNGGAREAEVSPTKRDSSFYKLLKCLTGSYSYKKVMIERSNPQGVNRVSRIDRAARVLFPLSFIILNIIYWMTYTKYAQL
ncbi:hypothetical protein CAPTEDRAFT_148064 [Capitella teleta]|uniref:Neurotransmitter-gated ion-channel ligand-binding domain-containing protein n=1 Tax=Capitella teleta TaxID=283909 RepID=R7UPT2_CAPTE|nr:hypothetical protein CAPTEDRAFT_148064 [Capitella teleta]|eukprot:ELU08088.1 hypothetical protein CAPTEDRAFT_148064 [Capitella teleta]